MEGFIDINYSGDISFRIFDLSPSDDIALYLKNKNGLHHELLIVWLF